MRYRHKIYEFASWHKRDIQNEERENTLLSYSADGATKVSSPQQKRWTCQTAEGNERETLAMNTRHRKCETIFGRFIKGRLLIVWSNLGLQ